MNTYNHYKLIKSTRGFLPAEVNDEKIGHFISPDTESVPKIYVVKHKQAICYVGITSQSMSTRIRIGCNDNGHYGYHGYKWKELDEVDMYIWCFPGYEKSSIEAIEGELVYFIRENTRKWPTHQMEIHFHPDIKPEESRIAESIYNQCL